MMMSGSVPYYIYMLSFFLFFFLATAVSKELALRRVMFYVGAGMFCFIFVCGLMWSIRLECSLTHEKNSKVCIYC